MGIFKKLPLPEEGEKFRIEHLPPIALAVYSELSRLSQVPVEEMLPIYNKGRWLIPAHALVTDRVHISPRATPYDLTHELLHSVLGLANLGRLLKKPLKHHAFRSRTFLEPAVSLHASMFSFLEEYAGRGQKIRRFYRAYGAKGILLLYAYPVFDANHLGEWKKRMTDNGFFNQKTGITERGEKALKRFYTKSKIRDALDFYERNRKEG